MARKNQKAPFRDSFYFKCPNCGEDLAEQGMYLHCSGESCVTMLLRSRLTPTCRYRGCHNITAGLCKEFSDSRWEARCKDHADETFVALGIIPPSEPIGPRKKKRPKEPFVFVKKAKPKGKDFVKDGF